MPVLGTFSNLSKRGFGGFVPKYVTTNGVWVPTGAFDPDPFPAAYKPFMACALSGDGQRQLGLFGNYDYRYTLTGFPTSSPTNIFPSSNYGANFAAVSTDITASRWAVASMSYTGQYQCAGSGGLLFATSSDFGATFTARDLTAYGTPEGSNVLVRDAVIGNSGQRMLLIASNQNSSNQRLLTSQDFGATFATSYVPLGSATAALLYKAKIQNNGERMFVSGYLTTSGAFTSSHIWRSVNNGITWASIFETSTTYCVDCAVSDSGQYVTIITGEPLNYGNSATDVLSSVYVSSDYAFNFSLVHQTRNSQSVAMSGDGRVQVIGNQGLKSIGTTDDGLLMSTDYGQTWTRTSIFADFLNVAVSKDGNVRLAAGMVPWEQQASRLAQSFLYLNID